jgi:hypothetical protein
LHCESNDKAHPHDISLLKIRAAGVREFLEAFILIDKDATFILARNPFLICSPTSRFDPWMDFVRDRIDTVARTIVDSTLTENPAGENVPVVGGWIVRVLPSVLGPMETIERLILVDSGFDDLMFD